MNKLIQTLALTEIPTLHDSVRDDLADTARENFPTLYQLNRTLDSDSEANTRGLVLGLASAYYALTVELEDDPFGAFGLNPPDIDLIQEVEDTFSGQRDAVLGMTARDLAALAAGTYPDLEQVLDGAKTELEEEFQSGVTVGLTSVAVVASQLNDSSASDAEAEDGFDDLAEEHLGLVEAEEDYSDPRQSEGPQPTDEDAQPVQSLSQLLGELQALNHGAMPSLLVGDDGLLRISLAVVCDDSHNVDLLTLQRVRDLLARCSPGIDGQSEPVTIRAIDSSIVVTATLPDFAPMR